MKEADSNRQPDVKELNARRRSWESSQIQDWTNMAELLSDFNWADYLPWVWKARKEAEARLQAELSKQAAQQMA